ncbi:DUF6364 family protein [Treponema denticola]|uniref:DUF6364 family protein n=1 Tax=Treponema denticola TaxID=158 RepID=UPI0002B5EEE8|nr:DUF6364 family protein [Treponema denticola]EMB21030.1 hypothetical protein HMPREF9724_02167 [Treponema denticola SP37]EPF33060.1 hypothetical protein HMPREF9734_02384 [Treponema denticola SP44]EPF40538.1 hypothetical protein HMPREF9731_00401 [Treponema denticola SP23]
MKTELILKIDKNIAESMREYAVKNKKSISKLVEDFFKNSITTKTVKMPEISPLVKELTGIINENDLESISYMSYLEKKYE